MGSNSQNKKKLVILEFIDEAEHLIGIYGQDFLRDPDVLIVCLHPNIRAYLKKINIESSDTVLFLNNDTQHEIILKTEDITEKLLNEFKFKDCYGAEEGYKDLIRLHLRLYILLFFRTIEILKNICGQHAISEIYCCKQKDINGIASRSPFVSDYERFLGYLVEDFCNKKNIISHVAELRLRERKSIQDGLRQFVRLLGRGLACIDYFFSKWSGRPEEKTIVVPAVSYRMDLIVKDIRKMHSKARCVIVWEDRNESLKQEVFKIKLMLNTFISKFKGKPLLDKVVTMDLIEWLFKKDKEQHNQLKKEFKKLKDNITSKYKEDFICSGVSVDHYVTLKIERGLEKVAHELLHSTKVLYHTFKRLKPQLLMAMYSGGIYCHMGEVARQMNICSLNISHGTHVPPNNKYEHIENFRLATSVIINTYKYVAVQTPWTNRFLDYYGDKRPRLFTGPLLYSKITKDDCLKNRKEFVGSNNNIKLILHATTLKRGRRGRLHITETLDEYISGLSDLVRAVNQLSDVFLVIRPHPVCDMTDEQLLALLPASEKIKIFRKGTFSSVLSAVDMLISYSSTCIEEALQNKIPVVLFDKWKRYNHFNIEETQSSLQLKRNPVFYITKPEILSASMDKILKIFDVDPLDEADLALYKYPEDYINNFYNFINEVIETAK